MIVSLWYCLNKEFNVKFTYIPDWILFEFMSFFQRKLKDLIPSLVRFLT